MTDKTFEKHKLVVNEYLINDANKTDAYLKHYPKASYKSAVKSFDTILDNPRIQEYIKTIKKEKSEKFNITYDFLIQENLNLYNKATDLDKIGNAQDALKELAKLTGAYEKDNSQKQPQFNMPVTEWLNQK